MHNTQTHTAPVCFCTLLISSFFRILKVLTEKCFGKSWMDTHKGIFFFRGLPQSKEKNSGLSISMIIWVYNLERSLYHRVLMGPLKTGREMNPFASLLNTCSFFPSFCFSSFKTWQWMKSENLNEPLRKPPTRKLAFSHLPFLSPAFPCCLPQSAVPLPVPRPLLSPRMHQNFCQFPKIGPGKSLPQKLSRFQTLRKKPPWIYLAYTLQISRVGPNQSNFLRIFHGVLYFRFGVLFFLFFVFFVFCFFF